MRPTAVPPDGGARRISPRSTTVRLTVDVHRAGHAIGLPNKERLYEDLLRTGLRVGVLIVALGGSWAQAADPSPATTNSPPAASHTSLSEGTITAVNVHAHAPQIEVAVDGGKPIPIQLASKTTTVWEHGDVVPWNHLKVGQRVNINHSINAAQDVASAIHIVSEPGASTVGSSPAPKSPALAPAPAK